MRTCLPLIALFTLSTIIHAQPANTLATQLRELDGRVIVVGKVRTPPLANMLARDVASKLRIANRADTQAWENVKTSTDWEKFRDVRLQALRASLGEFPPVPRNLKIKVTGTHEGEGYRVDNIIYETRPGLLVTANLYRPLKASTEMPGILICTSHQQPKHTGARQDMAMTWARAGCLVLVPDHLGHGERRQHPFGTATDSAPHDYHFRYDTGMQLALVGESLMGWLVWDQMRAVDVLLKEPGIDAKKIIVISEPAGGGDVAAVTAALDDRIAGVLVNNFGGPQPETAYSLPRDAEQSFEFAGSGSFESTRCLRLSARDGFMPWMIDAAIAPRRLIYYHEFYWDQDQDPVWKRLQKVYAWRDAKNNLEGLAGKGFVVGTPPENTHWIAINREIAYPLLERWFGIPNPKKEYSKQRPAEELLSLNPEIIKEYRPQPLNALLSQLGEERTKLARDKLKLLDPAKQKETLQQEWAKLLGDVVPPADPKIIGAPDIHQLGTATVERIHLSVEPGIVVPVLLLKPVQAKEKRVAIVIAVAQEGKQEFLKQRAEQIAELLAAGIAVALPDVRGTGETSLGDGRGRVSAATNLSASEFMLGQSLLGGRLRDLRSVMRYLRTRTDLDAQKLGLWGESFAPANAADRELKVPYTGGERPSSAEPLGGLLALLASLYENDMRAIYIHGGLSDYQSALQSQFVYLPHDTIVPGILKIGDLSDLANAHAPRPLWLDGMVDGHNRQVSEEILATRYETTRAAFAARKATGRLRLTAGGGEKESGARWLIGQVEDR
ncbi:MAG: hypothetical protein K8T89_08500 [Planctomycetes bacterium]|nr:hypothetical protein [Planctomycetota bacterium]